MHAVNPQLCRNYFRTLVGIYTKAYKQDNYAIVDKISKQFTEQIAFVMRMHDYIQRYDTRIIQ